MMEELSGFHTTRQEEEGCVVVVVGGA